MRLCLLVLFTISLAAQTVTHGPILGRPGANHMGIWVRTSAPATFQVRYGTEPGKLTLTSKAAQTALERDNTGWVLLEGLKAGTKYYYELTLPPHPRGSFRTLADAELTRNAAHNPRGLFNLRFEFACGNNQNPASGVGPSLPAFQTMLTQLKDKIDFAVLNGDWLYEEMREYSADQWLSQVRITPAQMPRLLRLAPTIAGVWENYKLYLSRGRNLAAWHREIPSYFVLDDHEILNDVYGTGKIGLRDRRATFRDIGVQAWYDYLGWSNPVSFRQGIHFGRARLKSGSDILSDPEADFTALDLNQAATLHVHWGTPTAGVNEAKLDKVGGDPNAGVYEIVQVLDKNRLRIRPAPKRDGEQSYSIGRLSYFEIRLANCHFFFLDTRTHRELPAIGRQTGPGPTMIGARQKQWLRDGMARSDADFFFVFSSVNMMIPHVGGTDASGRLSNKEDAWTGFLSEREELLRFWDSLGKPVFVLTGDLHNSFAIRVTDRVWEFASGPHNSRNHPASSEGGRPANGRFNSLGRDCEIRWSSYILDDVPGPMRARPVYCVVQVNNVFNNPRKAGEPRWVAFPRPQVVFQYYDGLTSDLLYAEPVLAAR